MVLRRVLYRLLWPAVVVLPLWVLLGRAAFGVPLGAQVLGQIVRTLVAGPGSAVGRYPLGNTGRSNVPATQPMPVPEDLAELLTSG